MASFVRGSIEKSTYYFEEAALQTEYAIYVPRRYDENVESPLVVLLHALFSNPHQVIRFPGITAEAEKHNFIVVAPFGYNDRGWYGSRGARMTMPGFTRPSNLGEVSEKDVLNVVSIIRKDFNIDARRMYLMGHSMGGSGTLHFGATYPQMWAAIAPMSPGIFRDSPTQFVEKTRLLPVFLVTGDSDCITRVEPARQWVSAMRENGMDLSYKEIPWGTHSWPIFGSKTIGEIFAFFGQHCRPSDAPDSIISALVVPNASSKADAELATAATVFRRPTRCDDLAFAGRMLYQHGLAGMLPAFFVLASSVSFLRAELLAWSLFYSTKSLVNSFSRRCARRFNREHRD